MNAKKFSLGDTVIYTKEPNQIQEITFCKVIKKGTKVRDFFTGVSIVARSDKWVYRLSGYRKQYFSETFLIKYHTPKVSKDSFQEMISKLNSPH